MTGMETKRARVKCIARLTRWFVSFAELSCLNTPILYVAIVRFLFLSLHVSFLAYNRPMLSS